MRRLHELELELRTAVSERDSARAESTLRGEEAANWARSYAEVA